MTHLVRYSIRVGDPDVARLQDGMVLQGRAVGTTTVQVSREVCLGVVLCAAVHAMCTCCMSICSLDEVVLVTGPVPTDIVGPG